MSVFKPKGAKTYRMEFVYKGELHRKDTGQTSERAAKLWESNYKAQLADKLKSEAANVAAGKAEAMAFGHGCKLYYDQVALHQSSVDDTENALAWLQEQIGTATMIRDISDATLARIVAKRRGEISKHRMGPKWKDKPLETRLVSNSTVNRTVTEPLKRVLRWLAVVQKQTVQPIDWKRHARPEPKERVRELFADEQERMESTLDQIEREDHAALIGFAIRSGLRRMEQIALRWSDVDFGNRVIWITGKGNKRASVPMTNGMREIIFPLQGQHPEFVFTYRARTTHNGRRRGERHPYTEEGVKTLFRRLRSKAGLADYRWHDHRHTAGTRTMREAANPKVVQTLLRHSDIATTMKYAHVYDDDVLAAMEAAEAKGGRSRPGLAPVDPGAAPPARGTGTDGKI